MEGVGKKDEREEKGRSDNEVLRAHQEIAEDMDETFLRGKDIMASTPADIFFLISPDDNTQA